MAMLEEQRGGGGKNGSRSWVWLSRVMSCTHTKRVGPIRYSHDEVFWAEKDSLPSGSKMTSGSRSRRLAWGLVVVGVGPWKELNGAVQFGSPA